MRPLEGTLASSVLEVLLLGATSPSFGRPAARPRPLSPPSFSLFRAAGVGERVLAPAAGDGAAAAAVAAPQAKQLPRAGPGIDCRGHGRCGCAVTLHHPHGQQSGWKNAFH